MKISLSILLLGILLPTRPFPKEQQPHSLSNSLGEFTKSLQHLSYQLNHQTQPSVGRQINKTEQLINSYTTAQDMLTAIKKERNLNFFATNNKSGFSFIYGVFKGHDVNISIEDFDELKRAVETNSIKNANLILQKMIKSPYNKPRDTSGNIIDRKNGQYTINDAKMVLKTLATDNSEYYKIHLMPKTKSELYRILSLILIDDILIKNAALAKVMFELPYLSDGTLISKDTLKRNKRRGNDEIFPIVVIYFYTKNGAQQALNRLYEIEKKQNISGLGITPRYNRKITDLIYYAQGDGDDKKKYTGYFEDDSKNRAHYKPEAFKAGNILATVSSDGTSSFYLNNPSKNN